MINHPLSAFNYCPHCGSESFVAHDSKAKRCRQCGFIFHAGAVAAVAAFIHNQQGELLACVRGKNPHKGTLDLAGGFLDLYETAEEALMRELKEELNLEPQQVKYLFSLPNQYEYSEMIIHTLDLFYEVTINDFTPLKAADDVESFEFIPKEKLDPEQFGLSSIRRAITLYKQNLK